MKLTLTITQPKVVSRTGCGFVDYAPRPGEAHGRGELRTDLPVFEDVSTPWSRSLRERRISARIGLRACALALGLKASQMSDLERGIATIPDAERAAVDAVLAALGSKEADRG